MKIFYYHTTVTLKLKLDVSKLPSKSIKNTLISMAFKCTSRYWRRCRYVDKGAVNVCCILRQKIRQFMETSNVSIVQQSKHCIILVPPTDVIQSGRNDLTPMAKISGAAMTVINNRIYGGYSPARR